MLFLSVLAGLGVAAGWGFSDFASKKVVSATGPYTSILALQAVATILVCGFYPIAGLPFAITSSSWWLMLAGTILLTASWFLFYRALNLGNVSVMCALYSLYSVIPFGWQILAGKLQMDVVQWIGVLILFGAAVLVSLDIGTLKHGLRASLTHGIREITGAVVLTGSGFLMIDQAVQDVGWRTAYFHQQLLSLPEVVVILLLLGKFRASRLPSSWGWFMAVVLCNILAFVSLNAGMEFGYVSVVGIVGTFSVAVTAFLAWMLLKERLAMHQYAGIALGIAGIVSLSI